MPKSLLEWLWLLAIGFAFLFPSLARSDDIMDCVYRGQLAQKFAQTVAEGYPLETINVRFQRPPRNEQEQAEMDAYVEAVRAEVKPMLGMEPGTIGARVAETCAFEYGKNHGYMKDVSADPTWDGVTFGSPLIKARVRMVGSMPPLSERKVTEMLIGTASSTSIEGPPIGMAEDCNNLRYDLNVIGRAISDGKPEEALAAFAQSSLPQLGQERLDRILRQIKEAYAWKGPFIDWMKKEYAECSGNR